MIQWYCLASRSMSSQHNCLKVVAKPCKAGEQPKRQHRYLTKMSQQAAAGRGAGPAGRGGGGRKPRYFPQAGGEATKGFKSAISKIAQDTFNTGQNKFAAQFTQSRKNVANYLQRTSASEGYLVAQTVRTGKEQTIPLPATVDASAPNAADLKIIRD